MDIDVFVAYINETQESVAKGIKHFGLNMRSAIMTKAIRDKGYTYDKTKKEWVMSIVHTISHHVNSHDFTLGEQKKRNVVKIGFDDTTKVHQVEPVHTTSHDVNSHEFTKGEFTPGETSSHNLTQDEIESIRVMLKEWKRNENPVVETDLINRIEAISKDEKVRKTIVISKTIGDQLDEFCEVNRVQKSDVLALAIEEFIKTYK